MKILFKTENWLIKLETALLVILVVVMVTLSFLQVVLRITSGKSILWFDPLLRYFVLWAGFLGAALAMAHRKHFALDVLTKNLKPRLNRAAGIVSGIFIFSICVILMTAAVKFLKMETAFETKLFSIGSWQVPSVYMEFMIPLGFGLIIFHSLIGFFKSPHPPSHKKQTAPVCPLNKKKSNYPSFAKGGRGNFG